MKKLLVAAALVAASQAAMGGEFYYTPRGSLNVADLDGKINDLVSDKFTKRYPHKSWGIYIYTSTANAGTDGSALAFASVGVAKRGLAGLQPASRQFDSLGNHPAIINATLVQKKPYLIEHVRYALRDLMDKCETSPNCDID
ncbi:MAG: hypothetical protein ACK4FF_02000 [Limnobacter sp.]|uniref:hypothetical protein n=1 Tax=Limnobacter sp. TaxID=2003368 RepID=UPI00391D4E85